MGYTHYWSWSAFVNEADYKAALQDCRKIIKASPVLLGNGAGIDKPLLRNGFSCNGLGVNSHETFLMGVEPRDDYCKTARKDYDVVVVACLCAVKDRMGDSFCATSDGDPDEWAEGNKLAEEVLKRSIQIPQAVIDQIRMYGWAARAYRKKHPEFAYTPLDTSHPNHAKETVPDYAKG